MFIGLVVIPLNRAEIGVYYRPITGRLQPSYSIVPTSQPNFDSNDNCLLSKFIRSFWSACRLQSAAMRSLGLEEEEVNSLLSDSNFNTTIDTLLRGILPTVKRTLSNGSFTVQDLIGLRHATPDWPDAGGVVYLRVYTHQDPLGVDINDCGTYIGQTTVSLWVRKNQHENAINAHERSPHYDCARKSDPNNRYTIPLLSWSGEELDQLPSRFIDVAEQTMMLVFNSYHNWVRYQRDGELSHTLFAAYFQFLNAVASNVRSETGWQPLQSRGCNVQSPLFARLRTAPFYCLRTLSEDPSIRNMNTYRQAGRFVEFTGGKLLRVVSYRDDTGSPKFLRVVIDIETVRSLDLPPSFDTYLVLEIMHDGQPHRHPWIGCPSVGPFEEFQKASSLGIRIEWYNRDQRKWFTLPLQRQRGLLHWKEALKHNDSDIAVKAYRTAMTLIQAFDGITYTEPLNGFPRFCYFPTGKILELQSDHLQQTLQWVPRQRTTQPAPTVASWDYNFDLMRQQFDKGMTIVGPPIPPPKDSDFWVTNQMDARMNSGSRVGGCDLCRLSSRRLFRIPCEQDTSRTDTWVIEPTLYIHASKHWAGGLGNHFPVLGRCWML
jgi:hypothetical protein